MTACHQPVETIVGNEVPAAWFASGLQNDRYQQSVGDEAGGVVDAGCAAGAHSACAATTSMSIIAA